MCWNELMRKWGWWQFVTKSLVFFPLCDRVNIFMSNCVASNASHYFEHDSTKVQIMFVGFPSQGGMGVIDQDITYMHIS